MTGAVTTFRVVCVCVLCVVNVSSCIWNAICRVTKTEEKEKKMICALKSVHFDSCLDGDLLG